MKYIKKFEGSQSGDSVLTKEIIQFQLETMISDNLEGLITAITDIDFSRKKPPSIISLEFRYSPTENLKNKRHFTYKIALDTVDFSNLPEKVCKSCDLLDQPNIGSNISDFYIWISMQMNKQEYDLVIKEVEHFNENSDY